MEINSLTQRRHGAKARLRESLFLLTDFRDFAPRLRSFWLSSDFFTPSREGIVYKLRETAHKRIPMERGESH